MDSLAASLRTEIRSEIGRFFLISRVRTATASFSFELVGWVSDRLCSKSKGGRVTHRRCQDAERRDQSGGLRFSRHADGCR